MSVRDQQHGEEEEVQQHQRQSQAEHVPYPDCERYLGQPASIPLGTIGRELNRLVDGLQQNAHEDGGEAPSLVWPDSRGRVKPSDRSPYTGTSGVMLLYARLVVHLERFPDLASPLLSVDPDQSRQMLSRLLGRHVIALRTRFEAAGLTRRAAEDALSEHNVENASVCPVAVTLPAGDLRAGIGAFFGTPAELAASITAAAALRARRCIRELTVYLLSLSQQLAGGSKECAGVNEVLYGRAGYLVLLSRLYRYGLEVPDVWVRAAARRVIAAIFIDGFGEAAQQQPGGEWPLMWSFFGTRYLGAAHGISGIAYALMLWVDDIERGDWAAALSGVVARLAHVVALRPRCGAAVEDVGSADEEELMHWCHGPPGHVATFAKAHHLAVVGKLANVSAAEVEGDAARFYSRVVRILCDRVRERGVLRKGTGLCHGVAGNAYALLTAFRMDGDLRWLHTAQAMWRAALTPAYHDSVARYQDPQRKRQGIPDAPWSLMEGAAGYAYFLLDLISPRFSAFPMYESTTNPPMLDWVHAVHRPLGVAPQALSLQAARDHLKIAPGAWKLPLMDPAFADAFLDSVYAGRADGAKRVDALRMGRAQAPVVAAVRDVVERFAHSVMLADNPGRLLFQVDAADSVETEKLVVKGDRQPTGYAAPPPFAMFRASGNPATPSQARAKDTEEIEQTAGKERWPPAQLPMLRVWRAYVIRYEADAHPSIQSHTDACDITVNLCLRRTCRRGHLVLNESCTQYRHVPGEAVVFWGDIVHHTHSVVGDGERAQLVLLLNWMPPARGVDDKKPATTPLRSLDAGQLSDDVMEDILSYLPLRDLASASYTCRRLASLAAGGAVWYRLYQRNTQLTGFLTARDAEDGITCHLCRMSFHTEADLRLEGLALCPDCQRPYHTYGCDNSTWPPEAERAAEAGSDAGGGDSILTGSTRYHELAQLVKDVHRIQHPGTTCPGCNNKKKEDAPRQASAVQGMMPLSALGRDKPLGSQRDAQRRFRYVLAAGVEVARLRARFGYTRGQPVTGTFGVKPAADDGDDSTMGDADGGGDGVVALTSFWRDVYRAALLYAGAAEEALRKAEASAERQFWRAIIGMYPIHDLHALRRRAPAAATTGSLLQDDDGNDAAQPAGGDGDPDDVFATCPECLDHVDAAFEDAEFDDLDFD